MLKPSSPEVLQATASGVGLSKSPRKNTNIYTRKKNKTKTKQEPLEKVGGKWILECKRDKKRDSENSAWFADREANVGNWWKNPINQIRMIKSKGWVTNIETETIRKKLENEGRDEVN